ncbi:MAG: tape measure protein [Candidimonas sp.]
MAESVGSIYYEVEADTSKLVNSSSSVDKSLDSMRKRFAQTDGAARQTELRLTKTASAVKGLGRQSGVAKEAIAALSKVIAGLVSIRTATTLIQMAEGYNEMSERIQMATRSAQEYRMVQGRLLANANDTYRSLAEAQEMYIRTADSLRSMGYSTSEVLDITDSMSYLFVTNAASVDRANTAITAYTKSINKGKVESVSWESIIAAVPSIINDISEASGKSAAEIRKLGAEGKLTAQMLNEGLRKSLDSNKAAADGMQVTVKDALVAVRNNLTVLIGEANKASGTTDGLAQSINRVAEAIQNSDIDTLVRELDAINDMISMVGDGFSSLADLVESAAQNMGASIDRSFSSMALTTAKEVDGISKVFRGTAGAIGAVWEALANNIPAFFSNAWNEVKKDAASFVNGLADMINVPLRALGRQGIGHVSFSADGIRAMRDLTEAARDGWSEAAQGIGYYDEMLAKIGDRAIWRSVSKWSEEYAEAIDDATKSTRQLVDEAGKGSKKLQKAIEANRKVIDGLAQSLYEAGLSGEALAVAKARASLNEFATADEVKQVEDLARAINLAQEAATKRQKFGTGVEADKHILGSASPLSGGVFDDQYARYEAEAQSEQERYAAQLERLKLARELQIETQRSYDDLEAQAAQQHADRMAQIDQAKNSVMLASASNAFGALADIMRQSKGEQSGIYRAMFAASKAFAVADATVNAWSAISKAWNSAPFPANLPAVAATTPAVMSVISSIQGANYSGRQYGGGVGAGKMYRINETGAPEVLNAANGQQFLLPNARGEVVSNKDAARVAGSAVNVSFTVIEDPERGGQVERSTVDNGDESISYFVADIRGGGRGSRALEQTYGLQRRGS